MHIFSETWLGIITRVLLAFIPALVILVPVALLSFVKGLALRLCIVLVATTSLVMALSVLAKVKLGDLCIGGATYV